MDTDSVFASLPLASDLPTSGSVLFIHTNYPAQFRFLVKEYLARGWSVAFASHTCKHPPLKAMRHIPLQQGPKTLQASKLDKIEANSLQAFADLLKAKRQGLKPDLIYCHSGWGLGSFLKDLFPRARLIAYSEWWFDFHAEDFRFDPGHSEIRHDLQSRLRMLLRNQGFALELIQADAIVAPTEWQRSQLQAKLRQNCQVIFDGIDSRMFRPESPTIAAGSPLAMLPPEAPLLTYATRGLEPYRGFPEFAEAALRLLQERGCWHVAIAGKDQPSYFRSGPKGGYGAMAMARFEEAGVADRVHLLGRLPLGTYTQLLQRSDLHCYFTRPYVLSWSLLEAALCGCRLFSSDVAPVREFLSGDRGSQLVDHTGAELPAELIQESDAALTEADSQNQGDSSNLKQDERVNLAKRRLTGRGEILKRVERRRCVTRHLALAAALLA